MSRIKNENNNLSEFDLNMASYKIKIEQDYIPQRSENFKTENIPKNDEIENKNIFKGNKINADKINYVNVIKDSEIKLEVFEDDSDIVSDNFITHDNYGNIPHTSKNHKHIHSGDINSANDEIKLNYTNGINIDFEDKPKIRTVNPKSKINHNNCNEQFVCNSTKSFYKPLTLKIKRVVSNSQVAFDTNVKVEDNFENYLNTNGDSFKQDIVPSGDQPKSKRRVYDHLPIDASVKLEDDLYNHLIGDSFSQGVIPSGDRPLKTKRVAENHVPVNASVKQEDDFYKHLINSGDSFYQDVVPSGHRSLKLKIKRVASENHVAYETNVKLEDNFNSDQFDCGIFNSEPSSTTDKSNRYNDDYLTNFSDFNYKTVLDSSKNNTNINMNPDLLNDSVIDPKDSYYSLQRSCRSKINLEENFDDVPTDSSDPDYEPPIASKSKIKWVYPGDGSSSTSNKLEDDLSYETSKSSVPKTKRIRRRGGNSGGTKKKRKDDFQANLVDSDYKAKVLLKSGVKRIFCKTCGMKFAQIAQLTRHNVVYHSEKPFKCEMCDSRFLWVTDLAIHNRVHSGEKPYTCEVCDKSFAFKSTFTIHKRAHSGDKPYKCNICDKRFVCTSDMNRHKRIHSGEMPYKCDVCKKRFRFSGNFSKHKRTHEKH